MIRKFCGAVLAALILLLLSAASGETAGFGFVNAADVALRRGPGGKVLVRLPENTCVWIKGSETDCSGVLWYEINAGLHTDGRNVDFTGWMKAEFIDAGDSVWYGVKSVEASGHGIVALRSDGTMEAAGSFLPPGAGRPGLRQWSAGLRDVRYAGFCELGWTCFAVDGGGVFHSSDGSGGELGGNRLRVAGGNRWIVGITEDNRLVSGNLTFDWIYPRRVGPEMLSRVVAVEESYCRLLLLTGDGSVLAAGFAENADGEPEPDWESWTDVVSLDASVCSFSGGGNYKAAYAAVRSDGTVLAAPAELDALIGGWTDMKKIAVGTGWVLGLKRDGTVLCAGTGGAVPPDVSGWTGIADIGTGYDFCAGVKSGGAMVFAGEHVFMNEGHSRK